VTDTATPAASYLTQEAYDRLKKELTKLTGEDRAEISKKIEAARDEGDLKENGGYHAAKEEQGKMEARIRQLTQLLEGATVGQTPPDDGIVEPGMVVTVELFGDKLTFLLGNREIAGNSDLEVYSEKSPMGKAILDHKAGDVEQPGIGLRAHELAIVGQHQEEDKRGRHQDHRQQVGVERDRKQWCAGNQHDRRSQQRDSEIESVETGRFGQLAVEAVGTGEGFSEGVGDAGGNRHRRQRTRLDQPQREEHRHRVAADGPERLGEAGPALELADVDVVSEERSGHHQRGASGDGGQHSPKRGVNPALGDVTRCHALVDRGALLEEHHPGGDRGADV